jgi:ATP-binding cassette subfamily C protein CydD
MSRENPAAQSWLREERRRAERRALPLFALELFDRALAALAALAAGTALGAAVAPASASPRLFFLALALFGLAAGLRALLLAASERLAVRLSHEGRGALRAALLARLLASGPALLRRRHSAELAALLLDAVESLEGFYGRAAAAALTALGGPLLVVLFAFALDPRAGFLLACCGLLVPFGMALAGVGAARAAGRQFLALSRLQTRFLDRVRGIATLIFFGRIAAEAEALGRAAEELRKRTLAVLRVAFLSSSVLDLAMVGAIIGVAVLEARAGASPERAIALLFLVPEFFAPLRAFSLAYQDRMRAKAASEAFAALPPLPPARTPATPVRTIAARGVSVAFERVSVVYDPARRPALEEVSFRLAAGETLILRGPSGAGKSTILDLLLGFVTPHSGRVLINGIPLEDLTPEARLRLIGWVGQRPLLFAGTIADNIRLAKRDATDEDVARAAASAGVMNFAAKLPRGLATPIGEGGFGLSGGEAQRVAIARCYLKDAPLLLLDEPTAHLDPTTERLVLDSLRHLVAGRTVLIASHATAVFSFGSRILDLREGRVVGLTRVGSVA